MTPTKAKELAAKARRAKALAYIAEHGEVTSQELATHLQVSNPAGVITGLNKADLIKFREVSVADTYGNAIRLYSLKGFKGPLREYKKETKNPPFLLGAVW